MEAIIYLAGNSWDAVSGTDKGLAQALAKFQPVLWVDPPLSILRLRAARKSGEGIPLMEQVGKQMVRLRTVGPPGLTRPGLRRSAEALYHRSVRTAVNRLGWSPAGTICSSPIMTLDKGIAGPSLFFVTDDWISGAALMGFSATHLDRVLSTNARRATVVAAVSNPLGQRLTDKLGGRVEVVPNGCHIRPADYAVDPGSARAALVGQLNERLDLDVLEAVADTGIEIAVAGPTTAKDSGAILRLNAFLARPNVHWHGVLSSEDVATLLAASNVGLTPYVDTAFNRSSFPLKTLEYVAAGLAVVTTHLPAVQLGPAKVRLARNAAEFASAVTELAAVWPTNAERAEQARQIKEHTWDKRAERVRTLLMP